MSEKHLKDMTADDFERKWEAAKPVNRDDLITVKIQSQRLLFIQWWMHGEHYVVGVEPGRFIKISKNLYDPENMEIVK